MALHTILVLGLCAQWVNSLAFVAARATQSSEHRDIVWSPVPTDGAEHQLLKRQQDAAQGLGSTIYRASNAVFGYTRDYTYYTYTYTYSTSYSYSYSTYVYQSAYSCPTSTETAFFQPALVSAETGRMGCCGSSGCNAPIKCMAGGDFAVACNGLPCETDSLTLKCTTGSATYCATFSLGGFSVQGFKCTAYPPSTTSPIHVYTYFSYTSGSSAYPYSDLSYSRSTLSKNTITESGSGSTAPPTITRPPSTASTGTTSGSSLPTLTPGPNAVPVGPIVGGAVGGFAILAIIGFALFFLITRHRKQKRESALNPDYSVVHQHQQQALSPPVYVTGGDKHTSMHSQAQFGSASPMSGGTSGMGRESYMSGPGFDGAGMAPYERQELDTLPSTVSVLPSVPYGGDGRH